MSDCQCALCVRQRAWRSGIFGRSKAAREEAFSQMLDSLYELESDREYMDAVLDGSWPDAAAVLERKIEKFQEILDDLRSRPTEPV